MSPVSNLLGDVQATQALLRKNWGWFLALGGLFIVLGMIGLGATVFVSLFTVEVFGYLLLIGGVVAMASAVRDRSAGGFLPHLLAGALYFMAGLLVVANPVLSILVFTLLIGISMIFNGILRIAFAFHLRPHSSWPLVLAGGVLNMLVGLLIVVRWPIDSLWVIGLFVSVDLLVHGWSLVMLALAARSTPEA